MRKYSLFCGLVMQYWMLFAVSADQGIAFKRLQKVKNFLQRRAVVSVGSEIELTERKKRVRFSDDPPVLISRDPVLLESEVEDQKIIQPKWSNSLWLVSADKKNKTAYIDDPSGKMTINEIVDLLGLSATRVYGCFSASAAVWESDKNSYTIIRKKCGGLFTWKVSCRRKEDWPANAFPPDVIIHQLHDRLLYIPR